MLILVDNVGGVHAERGRFIRRVMDITARDGHGGRQKSDTSKGEAYVTESAYDTYESSGAGWKLFAGIMIIIVGTFNVIDGLVAITNANYFKSVGSGIGGGNAELPLTNNIKTWGWVVLILGAILILSGFLIFVGNMFGRVIGVLAASVNAIVQLAYLPHYPLWSFTMILVDILVIWGIVVHGGRLMADA